MKCCLFILCCFLSVSASAQSKQEKQVLANSKLLENTVFGTKDSATLEKLFGSTLSYNHSSGKSENREQAIQAIIHSKSVYVWSDVPAAYDVRSYADSVMVDHVFKATEKKADGTEGKLSINIKQVWKKENGKWKLFRREATKVQ